MVAWLIISSLLPLASAEAAPKFRDEACPSAQQLANQIKFCSQNSLAIKYAKECRDEMEASWKLAQAALQLVLAKSQSNMKSEQDHALVTSRDEYRQSYEGLQAQVKLMQKYTSQIASYAQAMLNFRDAKSLGAVNPCYDNNFKELQAIVTGLDKKIIEAKKARNQAYALLKNSQAGHENVGTIGVSQAPVTGNPAAPGKAPDLSGKKIRQSDVSGTEELKKPAPSKSAPK